MIVEFRVSNFKSISDEQVLSFVCAPGNEHPESFVEYGGLRLLRSLAIYGPNASGKSNIINALSTMVDIVSNSASRAISEELPIIPFLLDEQSSTRPSTMELTFICDGVRFQYGFSATRTAVESEWLIAYPKGKPQSWFERNPKAAATRGSIEIGNSWWKLGSFLKGGKTELAKKTRKNALFLSVGAAWNNEQLLKVFKEIGEQINFITPSFTPIVSATLFLPKSEAAEKRLAGLRSEVLEILRWADDSITSLVISSQELEGVLESDQTTIMELQDTLLGVIKDKESIHMETVHTIKGSDKSTRLPFSVESDGTRRIFEMSFPLMIAIEREFALVIDEINSNLHPLLAKQFIEYFHRERARPIHAQLIFTTHDTTLLNSDLFRRDQIWLTEKTEQGSTRLRPLSDYSVRKDEALQKGYLAGRYGAVPIFESFSETKK